MVQKKKIKRVNKSLRITLRITKGQRKAIKERAALWGVSESSFIRTKVFSD